MELIYKRYSHVMSYPLCFVSQCFLRLCGQSGHVSHLPINAVSLFLSHSSRSVFTRVVDMFSIDVVWVLTGE